MCTHTHVIPRNATNEAVHSRSSCQSLMALVGKRRRDTRGKREPRNTSREWRVPCSLFVRPGRHNKRASLVLAQPRADDDLSRHARFHFPPSRRPLFSPMVDSAINAVRNRLQTAELSASFPPFSPPLHHALAEVVGFARKE